MIQAIKSYIAAFPRLEGKEIMVDFLDPEAGSYCLDQLPTGKVLSKDILGNSLREYHFGVLFRGSVTNDSDRICALQFYDDLSDWFDEQTEAGNLPAIPGSDKIPLSVSTSSWAYMSEKAEDLATGKYQINCVLQYEKNGGI